MSDENLFDDPEMVESFLMEADEIVEQLDDDLVTLETQPDDVELLGAIFRGVHTLKGMAGFLGFTQFVQLAHETESVLDLLRKQALSVDLALMDVILEAIDLLKQFLEDIRSQNVQSRDLSEISAKLEGLVTDPGMESPVETSETEIVEEADSAPAEVDEAIDSEREMPDSTLAWLQEQGGAPAAPSTDASEVSAEIESERETLTAITEWSQEQEDSPATQSAEATGEISGALAWLEDQGAVAIEPGHEPELELSADATSSADLSPPDVEYAPHANVTVAEIGETLGVTETTAEPDPNQINIDTIPVDEISAADIGDIAHVGAKDAIQPQERVDDILQVTVSTPGGAKSTAETDSPAQPTAQATHDLAGKPSGASIKQETASTTIRVDVKRLEEMMNLIGELVLERNRLLKLNKDFEQKLSLDTFEAELSENSTRLNRLTTDLQRSILSIRMLPIGTVFKKFPRIVRDIARDLNKEVELILSGEETELDKTIVDVISEPLVHLIRNSADHGIETPEVREAAGKPRKGKVWLSASHAGNQIIIEIVDDGKGIDPQVVGQKAIEKGMITEAQLAEMSDKEILNLIFMAGFSTAKQVSKVSGRGVGMDVVRTTIQKFNGTIELESGLGKGSRVSLKLPLTLAIIQGLIVKVGIETFAIPLSSVIETVRVTPDDIQQMKKREVLDLRNEVLPLIRLREALECTPIEISDTKKNQASYVVVLGIAEQHLGVIVDELIGEEEIVVKSLGYYLGNVPGIAGATIMGDGRPAVILEVSALMGIYGESK